MRRCRELSRLPPTGPLKSLNFRRTTPGSLAKLYAHYDKLAYGGPLDPKHPAAAFVRQELWKTMPNVAQPGFRLRAFPQAVLMRPLVRHPDPPFSPAPKVWPGGRRANVSVLSVTTHVHKSPLIRRKVITRTKAAWGLVVTRGATVESVGNETGTRKAPGGKQEAGKNKETELRIVFSQEDVGAEKWLLDGWTYWMQLSLEIYRMPFEDLIPRLRTALLKVKGRGQFLERQWTREARAARKFTRPSDTTGRSVGQTQDEDDTAPVVLPPKSDAEQSVDDMLEHLLSQHLENMEKTLPSLDAPAMGGAESLEDDVVLSAFKEPTQELSPIVPYRGPKDKSAAPRRSPTSNARTKRAEDGVSLMSRLYRVKPIVKPGEQDKTGKRK